MFTSVFFVHESAHTTATASTSRRRRLECILSTLDPALTLAGVPNLSALQLMTAFADLDELLACDFGFLIGPVLSNTPIAQDRSSQRPPPPSCWLRPPSNTPISQENNMQRPPPPFC